MPFPIAAAIGGGVSLLNSVLGQGQAKRNQQRQFTHNKQMADLEYQRNIEMWNKQNEYNAPQSQMERYSKAGLNPNLIYGQGDNGNAREIPKYSVDRTDMQQVPALNMGEALSAYNSTRIANAQIDQMEQQTALNKEKTVNEAIQTLILGSQTSSAESKAKIDSLLAYYSGEIQQNIVSKGQWEIQNIRENTHKTATEIEKINLEKKGVEFENAMKAIDLNWLKENGASRLEPQQLRLIKELFNMASGKNLKEIIKKVLTFK